MVKTRLVENINKKEVLLRHKALWPLRWAAYSVPAKPGHDQTALSLGLQDHQPRLRLACFGMGLGESGST